MTTTTPGSRPSYDALVDKLDEEQANFKDLSLKYHNLENSTRKKVGAGFLGGGGIGALITALLMHSCYGTKTVQPNAPDCKPVSPVINVYCEKSRKSDNDSSHPGKKNTSDYETKTCPDGQSCYDNDLDKKLKKCLDENEELQKRPEHCPKQKYTPNQKVCPPVKECPPVKKCEPTPYLRKGE